MGNLTNQNVFAFCWLNNSFNAPNVSLKSSLTTNLSNSQWHEQEPILHLQFVF